MHTFPEAVKTGLKNFGKTAGRASRAEFWWWHLYFFGTSFLLIILAKITPISEMVGGLFVLAMLLPTIAVMGRRMHDIGRTEWWILLNIIPIVGNLIVYLLTLMPGDSRENKYGQSPYVTKNS